MLPRREWLLLALLLLPGLCVRIAYLVESTGDPLFEHPALDAAYHDHVARGLAFGDWSLPDGEPDPEFRETPFYKPPGYPVFLALCYRVTGGGAIATRAVQMLMGLASCVVGYLFARRWFARRVAGLYALLLSLYWGFIYFEGELLSPGLSIFLSLMLLAVLTGWVSRMRFGKALLAGMLIGLLGLVRPNLLLFAPAVCVWYVWVIGRKREWVRLAAVLVGTTCGALLIVLPVTIRNHAKSPGLILVSCNGPITFHYGNHPTADGYTAAPSPELAAQIGMKTLSPMQYPRLVRALEEKLRRNLTYAQAGNYLTAQTWAAIRENPRLFISHLWRKTLLFWGPREVASNREVQLVRDHSQVLRHSPGTFAMVWSSALLGIALLFWRLLVLRSPDQRRLPPDAGQAAGLVLLFVQAGFISVVPFLSASRFRLPVMPGLLLFSAYGVSELWEYLRRRSFVVAGAWCAVGLVLFALCSANFSGYRPRPAAWHAQRGVAYARGGDPARAIEEYIFARDEEPGYPDLDYHLSVAYAAQGQRSKAYEALGRAALARPDDDMIFYNLGVYRLEDGELAQARTNLLRAVSLNARNADAWFNLGVVDDACGKQSEAAQHYAAVIRLDPRRVQAYVNLAAVQLQLGRTREAVEALRTALRLAPDNDEIRESLEAIMAEIRRSQL